MGILYLLHFRPSFKHAQHYLGFTSFSDVSKRVYQHLQGRGATLTSYAVKAGCKLLLVAKASGERCDERRLKRQHHRARFCPICCKQKRVGVRKMGPPAS